MFCKSFLEEIFSCVQLLRYLRTRRFIRPIQKILPLELSQAMSPFPKLQIEIRYEFINSALHAT